MMCVLASWDTGVAFWPDVIAAIEALGMKKKDRRFSREDGGFFIGPRDRGPVERKEVDTMQKSKCKMQNE
jgi:hypothetical protein